jgi:hypothetical protein
MVLFDHRAANNLPDVLTGAYGRATDALAVCFLAIATRITVFRLGAQGLPTVIGDCLQCHVELIAASILFSKRPATYRQKGRLTFCWIVAILSDISLLLIIILSSIVVVVVWTESRFLE